MYKFSLCWMQLSIFRPIVDCFFLFFFFRPIIDFLVFYFFFNEQFINIKIKSSCWKTNFRRFPAPKLLSLDHMIHSCSWRNLTLLLDRQFSSNILIYIYIYKKNWFSVRRTLSTYDCACAYVISKPVSVMSDLNVGMAFNICTSACAHRHTQFDSFVNKIEIMQSPLEQLRQKISRNIFLQKDTENAIWPKLWVKVNGNKMEAYA